MDRFDRSNQRLKNLLHDVEAITKACSQDKNCPFKEFQYGDYLFRFEYHSKNEKRYYWANLSEDYPNSSMLTWTVNGSEEPATKQFNLRLPFMFNIVAKELYREISIPVLCPSSSFTSESSRPAGKDDDDCDDDYDEGCDYDDDDENSEMNDDSGHGEDRNVCTLDFQEMINTCDCELQADFDQLQKFCGNAELNKCEELEEATIKFSISTDFLEDELARAWRLIPKTPIVVQAYFSFAYLGELSAAKVEVYQQNTSSEKISAGVLIQLQGILTSFVKNPAQEHFNQAAQNDSKFKTSRKTPAEQPMCSQKLKVPRLSSSLMSYSDPKLPPNLGYGFLVEIFSYAERRLHSLNDYCVICDELHTITNSAMLKPMVCDRPLCIFSYQTLGVMSSVAEDVAVETEVVDLLIAMAKAASMSARSDAIFDPYPTVVNPEKSTELAFTPANKTTVARVREVMNKIISMEDMAKLVGPSLKAHLDATDKLVFPLLQWIISSNRSHIVLLKPYQRLSFVKTPHQFLLRSSPPAKEAAFNAAKEKYGSVFAFHGSPIENWHSILRKGLLNASGTRLQINGAAYGKGIYLSPEASMSYSYSSLFQRAVYGSSTSTVPTSTSSVNNPGNSLHLRPPLGIMCIALCEVVDSKSLKKTSSLIWVMPEEDYVVTRFLFVFTDSDKTKMTVRSDNAQVLAEIRKAIQG